MLQEQTTPAVSGSTQLRTSSITNEFLTFRLGNEEYGIEILKVQEIRGYEAITQIEPMRPTSLRAL